MPIIFSCWERKNRAQLWSNPDRLEWSDLALFAIFENLHIFVLGIFLGGQFQTISKFGCAAQFPFLKNHKDLKIYIFEHLQIPSFYFKEQSPKRNF